jgi:predicted RNase H-like HicB family nuclease
MSVELPFSMIIRWSDEDRVYVVSLPEFGEGGKTHGSTYEEAAKNGHEVLEMLVESYLTDGAPLPKPDKFSVRPALTAGSDKTPKRSVIATAEQFRAEKKQLRKHG